MPFEDDSIYNLTVKIAGSQYLCGFPFSVLAKCLQFFEKKWGENMLLKEYYNTSLDYLLYGKREQKCDMIRLWENLDDCTQNMVRSIMESVVNNVIEYEQEKMKMEKELVS